MAFYEEAFRAARARIRAEPREFPAGQNRRRRPRFPRHAQAGSHRPRDERLQAAGLDPHFHRHRSRKTSAAWRCSIPCSPPRRPEVAGPGFDSAMLDFLAFRIRGTNHTWQIPRFQRQKGVPLRHCNGRILIPRDLPPTTGPCPHCGGVITSPAWRPVVPESSPIRHSPESPARHACSHRGTSARRQPPPVVAGPFHSGCRQPPSPASGSPATPHRSP